MAVLPAFKGLCHLVEQVLAVREEVHQGIHVSAFGFILHRRKHVFEIQNSLPERIVVRVRGLGLKGLNTAQLPTQQTDEIFQHLQLIALHRCRTGDQLPEMTFERRHEGAHFCGARHVGAALDSVQGPDKFVAARHALVCCFSLVNKLLNRGHVGFGLCDKDVDQRRVENRLAVFRGYMLSVLAQRLERLGLGERFIVRGLV